MRLSADPELVSGCGNFLYFPIPQEKISSLEEMLMIMPKHKGTDKLRAALRKKIAPFWLIKILQRGR